MLCIGLYLQYVLYVKTTNTYIDVHVLSIFVGIFQLYKYKNLSAIRTGPQLHAYGVRTFCIYVPVCVRINVPIRTIRAKYRCMRQNTWDMYKYISSIRSIRACIHVKAVNKYLFIQVQQVNILCVFIPHAYQYVQNLNGIRAQFVNDTYKYVLAGKLSCRIGSVFCSYMHVIVHIYIQIHLCIYV